MLARKKNIFIVGIDATNWKRIESVRNRDQYNIHSLLTKEEVNGAHHYDFNELLNKAEQQLKAFDGPIDAITGYYEFPTMGIVGILREMYGVPGTSLESIIKCDHKYLSRVEQKKVVPHNIPNFCPVDPFDPKGFSNIILPVPFWLKPAKAQSTFLGFRIGSKRDFDRAIAIIREKIGRYGDPYNQMLQHPLARKHFPTLDGNLCIAEELVSGTLHYVGGYMYKNALHVCGETDTTWYPNGISVLYHQNSSTLPTAVREEMHHITEKAMQGVGFDQAGFNTEFFYNRKQKKIYLIELNSRISASESYIFEKIHGASNHQYMIELALGGKPVYPWRQGAYKVAAKHYLRRFKNGRLVRVPTEAEMKVFNKEFPDTEVTFAVREGEMLSNFLDQDSYGYLVLNVCMGAQSEKELKRRYAQALSRLRFEVVDE